MDLMASPASSVGRGLRDIAVCTVQCIGPTARRIPTSEPRYCVTSLSARHVERDCFAVQIASKLHGVNITEDARKSLLQYALHAQTILSVADVGFILERMSEYEMYALVETFSIEMAHEKLIFNKTRFAGRVDHALQITLRRFALSRCTLCAQIVATNRSK